ncbi:Uncharacterised protein [Mycobacteroides abscessus subsp. abscessus]|nr:Uncharacterised protein [Mycobacteroides abscessus subsp. abscessus]
MSRTAPNSGNLPANSESTLRYVGSERLNPSNPRPDSERASTTGRVLRTRVALGRREGPVKTASPLISGSRPNADSLGVGRPRSTR